MFPYRDENPSRTRPYFVYLFLAINAGVFLYGLFSQLDYFAWLNRWGLRSTALWADPRAGDPPAWATVLAAPWLHAGWLHLLGNLWFLWLFGDNVEDQLGHGRFVFFYLTCGLLATLTHALVLPDSALPLVGASGAIAGVLAAYLRFFPRHRVRTLVWVILIFRVRVPAALFIVLWLAAQVMGQWYFSQAVAMGASNLGGVAYGAHIGGFVAGLVLAGPFAEGRPPPRKPPPPEPL